MRPLPTTAEYLAMHAAHEPRRLALREDGGQLDYGQLHGMVAQCALELQRLGVRRGDRLAVAGPGFGTQLVLLLAAEGLGAVTASFQAEGDPDAAALFARVNWIFSGVPQSPPPGVRCHLVDAGFVRRLAGATDDRHAQWTPLELHEPQRITRTSGSSGPSKFMLLSRQAQESNIRCALETRQWEMAPGTRLLVLSPLVANAGFARISGCLRRGSAVLFGNAGDLARMDPTHVIGLPLHLERLLLELPAGYAPPRAVGVATFGGPPAPALRQRAEAVFGSALVNRFGSNEAGMICDALDATGAGILYPGVDVRILDAQGQDVPPGHSGIIALRTPAMADGYLDQPTETAAAFRKGWFLSGDVGALVGPRRLRLAGRHDELVNVGGIKVPAAELEQKLRAQPAIADAAVLAVLLDGGAASIGIAVVTVAGATPERATTELQEALRLESRMDARVLFLSALPRLPGGKTDRMALLRLFQRESS